MKRFLLWFLAIYFGLGMIVGAVVGLANWGLPGLNYLWLVTVAILAWPLFVVYLALWMAGQ